MIYVGFDCSKAKFDAAYPKPVKATKKNVKPVFRSRTFDQTPAGMKLLLAWLPAGSHCVVEATGVYHLQLADYLVTHGHPVYTVNPLSIKRYGEMKQLVTKTDKRDAQLISNYGQELQADLRRWEVPSGHVINSKQDEALRDQLVKQRGALKSQREAIEQNISQSPKALDTIDRLIETLDQEIKELEKNVEQQVKKVDPEAFDLMLSIPSIGPRSAAKLYLGLNGFKDFTNYRQLAAYIGTAPRIAQSGSSINRKGGISKQGQGDIRKVLYMASVSAIRYNPACKAMHERMVQKGKMNKVILIAVVNKLLKQVWAVIRDREPWNREHALKGIEMAQTMA